MKTKHLFLFVSMTLITTVCYGGNPVNTEDNPGGIMQMEDLMADKARTKSNKQLMKAEKGQYRAEKRIAWISKVINKKTSKSQNKAAGSGENTWSLLSMICGIGGVLILIPLFPFGLSMGIAGFVLGFVSMKKEGRNTMNILGIILGGLILLFILVVALIWVINFGF